MTNEQLEKLKFPIGDFIPQENYTITEIKHFISVIETLPSFLREVVFRLSEEQLLTVYRPDGWTIRQVVHHLSDSHINSFIRFKLALTEDKPTIKPYEEALWAELPDGKDAAIELALNILDNIHKKWVIVLNNISQSEWHEKGFIHPEKRKFVSLAEAVALYAWHCKHHLAHITELKKRMEW
jgi:hypothetical protein